MQNPEHKYGMAGRMAEAFIGSRLTPILIITFILLGVFSARRAVRPLGTAAQAASAIAGGRLDTRLETTDDPDLRILTESFNDMASGIGRLLSEEKEKQRLSLMQKKHSRLFENWLDYLRAQADIDIITPP